MIWMFSPPCFFRCSRISTTSERLRIKDAATEVNALLATEDQVLFVFFSQCWQRDGNARQVNAFVFARSPLFSTLQITLLPSMAVTSMPIRPSSTRTVLPTDRSLVKPSQVYSNDFVVAYDRFVGGEGEGLARFQGNVITAFQFDGADFQDLWCRAGLRLFAGFAR